MARFAGFKVKRLSLYRVGPEIAPDMLRYDSAYIRRSDLREDETGRIHAAEVLYVETSQHRGWPTEARWRSFGERLVEGAPVLPYDIDPAEWVTLVHTVKYGGPGRPVRTWQFGAPAQDETFGGEYVVVPLAEEWKA